MLTATLFRSIAVCEINAWRDMYNAAGKDISGKFGIKALSIGSSCISVAKNIDILAYNRVLGFGLIEPATEQMLDEIISVYNEAGVKRFFIQIHPEAAPSGLKDWFQKRNIQHYNNWVKHYRNAENPAEPDTRFEIREVENNKEAEIFGEIITRSFEWPEEMKYWFAALFARKYWKTYLAFNQGKPAAAASLYVKDECGWLSFASTLPDFRGKGAQTALIAKRIRDAGEFGCQVLTLETSEDNAQQRSQSLQNVRKMGFEAAYIRPNFIWKSE